MKILRDFPLSSILYYKIGGKAKIFLEAENKEDVLEAIDYINNQKPDKFLVISHGANFLINDSDFDGIILHIKENGNDINFLGEGVFEVFAGEKLDDLIKFSFEKGYTGLEWAGGLPSSVGAAIRGNVGAFGGEIKDVVEKVEVIDASSGLLEIKTLNNGELAFSYRNSFVKQNRNLIVISATFKFKKASTEEIEIAKKIYFSNIEYRKSNHPLEFANSGSVFKNIEKKEEVKKILAVWPDIREKVENNWHGKVSMGYVINRLGFNSFQIGNAQVSPKHNNFIVNLGDAKFSDVKGIIDAIQQKFNETFGFIPEVEVEIVN